MSCYVNVLVPTAYVMSLQQLSDTVSLYLLLTQERLVPT